MVAQAAGVGGQDDQDDQDKQPKPKSKGRGGGRGRGRGRPKGKATAKETESSTVKCFAGRKPPLGKEKLEEFVSLQEGYTELKASASSAEPREYYKFFQDQKANYPDMPQSERVKKINEAWMQQH